MPRLRVGSRIALATLVASSLVACYGELKGDTLVEAESSLSTWANFRSDVPALVSRVQQDDGKAKKELLTKCWAQSDRLWETESRFATVAKTLCEDIKSEDAKSKDAEWAQIVARAERIEHGMREILRERTDASN